jgi:hypothetical protein
MSFKPIEFSRIYMGLHHATWRRHAEPEYDFIAFETSSATLLQQMEQAQCCLELTNAQERNAEVSH